MKYIYLLFPVLLLLLALPGQAQDRIITWKKDTISCTITNQGAHYIRFTVEQNGVKTKGKINRSETREVIYDEGSKLAELVNGEPYHWRVAASGGLGYLLGDTDPGRESFRMQGLRQAEIDDYFDQILWGWQSSASVHYFLQQDLAVGLQYRFFKSTADVWATFDPQDGVNLYHGPLKETMYVNFVGPSLYTEYSLSRNHQLRFSGSIAMGIAFYRDEATLLETNVLMTGKAFGGFSELGLEYFMAPRLSVGISLSTFLSSLGKLKYDNGTSSGTYKLEDEEIQSIASFDLSAGLRYYF
ncbi:hypothetical protein [Sunxiuqinia indica]|uniref:hypothetical protein n=1 Tax=Sunxiuqinia indica TaxID=2692584 RepID=UPI00135847D1|nr:hypothetical protein [Sunxiuqinia indica]